MLKRKIGRPAAKGACAGEFDKPPQGGVKPGSVVTVKVGDLELRGVVVL